MLDVEPRDAARKRRDLVPVRQQALDCQAPHTTRSSENDNFHGSILSLVSLT